MPNLPNFQLTASVETDPAKHLSIIETAFDRAYKGERGKSETPNEFMLRKVEEYIASIVTRFHVDDHILGMSRDLTKQANDAIKIRRPEVEVESVNPLGENDPTFMTERETALPKTKAKQKK